MTAPRTPLPPPLLIVDAFADGAFTGNPAAVCLLERNGSLSGWPDAAWMQRLAGEMNLSETAFVLPPTPDPESSTSSTSDDAFGLRWFTPNAEVELCGHATLASAHVLFHAGPEPDRPALLAEADAVRFQTRYAGVLTCRRDGQQIAMDFPAQRCRPVATPDGLLEALGLKPEQLAADRPVHFGPYDFLVELDTPERVAELEPSFSALTRFECRGVAVTAGVLPAHPRAHAHGPGGFRGARIVSRFFAPRLRVAEDPVTGSLHCVLATYWSQRLGTASFTAFQASPRGGLVRITLGESADTQPANAAHGGGAGRVILAGRAVTVLYGRLAEPPPVH